MRYVLPFRTNMIQEEIPMRRRGATILPDYAIMNELMNSSPYLYRRDEVKAVPDRMRQDGSLVTYKAPDNASMIRDKIKSVIRARGGPWLADHVIVNEVMNTSRYPYREVKAVLDQMHQDGNINR